MYKYIYNNENDYQLGIWLFFLMPVFILQDRTNSFESMKFSAFESQLLDIMRSTGDTSDMVKGKIISQFM